MASPSFDLDQLQQQMQTLLPAIDASALCCCRLMDPSLQPNDHLDDCELRLFEQASSDTSSKGVNDENADPSELEASARRRKHRESMARLRRGWRTSIAALQQQEKELQALLRRTISNPLSSNNDVCSDGSETMEPLEAMRRSYRELVEEQLRLQEEHMNLEATRAHKEKYERLLERELVRVRTFNATQSDA